MKEGNYMELVGLIGVLLGAIVTGAIAEAIGKEKTKSAFWWGFWLSLIGIIVVACMPSKKQENKYESLEKLKYLKDNNVITEEEFIEQKNKILGN